MKISMKFFNVKIISTEFPKVYQNMPFLTFFFLLKFGALEQMDDIAMKVGERFIHGCVPSSCHHFMLPLPMPSLPLPPLPFPLQSACIPLLPLPRLPPPEAAEGRKRDQIP
jgi:hypothetical protein